MKLWIRSVGSPINAFLRRVMWEDGAGAGSSGDNASGGQGQGQTGGSGSADTGSQGDNAPDWRSTIDPAIKDHASLKDIKTPADLAKSWVNVQPLIGVEKLPIPPKDAKPEVREKFLNEAYDRLGRPKEAKDYKLTDVKLPDGVNIKASPEALDALRAQAHKLGLLPHQLDGLYAWYMNDTASKVVAHEQGIVKARQDAEAALRTEYGAAYDGKVAKARELLQKFAGDDFKSLLDKGLGNDPAVIRFMSKMAEAISEDTFTRGTQESTMTPEEAKKEIPNIMEKLTKMQQSDPGYKELVARKRQLYEMAFPTTTSTTG